MIPYWVALFTALISAVLGFRVTMAFVERGNKQAQPQLRHIFTGQQPRPEHVGESLTRGAVGCYSEPERSAPKNLVPKPPKGGSSVNRP